MTGYPELDWRLTRPTFASTTRSGPWIEPIQRGRPRLGNGVLPLDTPSELVTAGLR